MQDQSRNDAARSEMTVARTTAESPIPEAATESPSPTSTTPSAPGTESDGRRQRAHTRLERVRAREEALEEKLKLLRADRRDLQQKQQRREARRLDRAKIIIGALALTALGRRKDPAVAAWVRKVPGLVRAADRDVVKEAVAAAEAAAGTAAGGTDDG